MKMLFLISVIMLAAGSTQATCATASDGLVAPPAINMPFGGVTVTEINLGDTDLLGVIKQMIPVLGNIARDVVGRVGSQAPAAVPGVGAVDMSAVSKIDTSELSEAIAGVTSVRIVVVKYGRKMAAADFLREFEGGVAKMGSKFSKIVSDFGFSPGAVALYAEEKNGGYLAAMYDPKGQVAYAARVVGFVDVPKITRWAGGLAQLFMNSATEDGEKPAAEPAAEAPAEPKS